MLQFALIVILVFTYELFRAERLATGRRMQAAPYLLFAAAIVLAMTFPIHITHDAHVDLRIVPLLLGTLYGGRKTGLALAVLILLYRLLIGIDPGFFTTAITLLVTMPAVLFFQTSFAALTKSGKAWRAFGLAFFYGVAGSGTSMAVRGVLAEVVQAHLVYLATIVVSAAFSVVLSETVRGMIERVRLLQNKAREAEIGFLRSQIRPHFLHNALNAIAELCVEAPRRAEELTLDLSQYLRRSFDFKLQDGRTTVGHELELVQAYLNIEQARYGDKLRVEYDIDASPTFMIPPLMLQPIVENAVLHGIRSSDLAAGVVRVSIRARKDGVVRFVVADNGIGMSATRVLEVLSADNGGQGVGLRNISRRLELLYGRRLSIESEAGAGTRVSFDIPAEPPEERRLGHAADDHRG